MLHALPGIEELYYVGLYITEVPGSYFCVSS